MKQAFLHYDSSVLTIYLTWECKKIHLNVEETIKYQVWFLAEGRGLKIRIIKAPRRNNDYFSR